MFQGSKDARHPNGTPEVSDLLNHRLQILEFHPRIRIGFSDSILAPFFS